MQHMTMPPHEHIIGMPIDIIFVMDLQHSMNMSLDMPAMGATSHTMPSAVILHVIVHIIIGIMFIIGMPPFIMGMEPIIGIMEPIGMGIMFMAAFMAKPLAGRASIGDLRPGCAMRRTRPARP